jgi:hypothetical protein
VGGGGGLNFLYDGPLVFGVLDVQLNKSQW